MKNSKMLFHTRFRKMTFRSFVLLLLVGLILTGCGTSTGSDNATETPTVVEKQKEEPKSGKQEEESKDKKEEGEPSKSKESSHSVAAPPVTKPQQAPPKTEQKATQSTPKNEPKADLEGAGALIPVTLVKTIDGDTIKIKFEGKEVNVRYLLIDTPETSHPRLGKQPFGENAKERNRQLVNSGNLAIEFDIGERYDKYGRILAYVYVDGKSVQKTLLEEGLARVAYVYPPNTRHLTPFEEAQNRAKAKKIGIWSIEDYVTSSGFQASSKTGQTTTGSSTATSPKTSGSTSGSTTTAPKSSGSTTAPKTSGTTTSTGAKEFFQNCTELRKVYPNGVPQSHPAYQSKMDRDKDGFACER